MKHRDLSIIIVSFNTKDFLLACIGSIEKNVSHNLSYEVIVVDNNSEDDSVQILRKQFPWVEVIASKENNGFSKANNLGLKQSNGAYVLFLNPDTLIYPETLETMYRFMEEHPDAGAATCYVSLPDGSLDDGSHRGFPTPWNSLSYFSGLNKLFPKTKLFSGYTMGWKNLKTIHTVDSLVGAFMFVRRTAGESISWWDEDYFFYGEDIDFCYKLKEKGWNIYFVPDVSILHYKGVSGGIKKHSQHLSTADKDTKIRATVARFNAMEIFYKKHYEKKYPKFVTQLVFTGIRLKRNKAEKKLK